MIIQIRDIDHFETEILDAGEQLVVADFGAEWCGPCRAIAGRFGEIAAKNSAVKFLKIDVESCPDIALKNEIAALPSFVFFRNKERIDMVRGSKMDEVEEMITKHLDSVERIVSSMSLGSKSKTASSSSSSRPSNTPQASTSGVSQTPKASVSTVKSTKSISTVRSSSGSQNASLQSPSTSKSSKIKKQ